LKIRPKILLAFGVPTVVMVIVCVVNLAALSRSLATSDRVRHTDQVIGAADDLLK
jgi:CHASE3 domain sensor protein